MIAFARRLLTYSQLLSDTDITQDLGGFPGKHRGRTLLGEGFKSAYPFRLHRTNIEWPQSFTVPRVKSLVVVLDELWARSGRVPEFLYRVVLTAAAIV